MALIELPGSSSAVHVNSAMVVAVIDLGNESLLKLLGPHEELIQLPATEVVKKINGPQFLARKG